MILNKQYNDLYKQIATLMMNAKSDNIRYPPLSSRTHSLRVSSSDSYALTRCNGHEEQSLTAGVMEFIQNTFNLDRASAVKLLVTFLFSTIVFGAWLVSRSHSIGCSDMTDLRHPLPRRSNSPPSTSSREEVQNR